MALEIFKLVGSIFVDSSKADESLSKTDSKALNIGKTLSNGVKTAAKWGAGICTAAGAVGTAMFATANNTADAASTIKDSSQKVGMSAEEYQKWSYAASMCGMEASALEKAMIKQQKTFSDAAEGSKVAASAYDRLGIDITKIRSSSEAFDQVIAALSSMEDETTRNALANDIFGKSYADLAPMLQEGSEGLKALKKEAVDLGVVMSNETVDAGEALGDTMDKVKQSAGGIMNQLGGSLIPMVQKGCDFLLANMPMIQGIISQMAPVASTLFGGLLPPLMSLVSSVFPLLISLITTIMPLATQIFETVLPIVVELLNKLLPPLIEVVSVLLPPLLQLLMPLIGLLSPIIELLNPILSLLTGILAPISDLITHLLTPLITIISKLITVALEPLTNRFQVFSDILQGAVKFAIDTIMNRVNTIKGVFSGLIEFVKGVFTGDWEKAWSGVTKIFTSIWEGLKNSFKIPINFFIDGINALIRGINRIEIPDWVPLVGGSGFNIKEIPRLYQGGVLEKGQTGFLEGTGAEAVVPLENNRKWINAVARDMDSAFGGASGSRIEGILLEMLALIERLAKMGIYLDSKKLVGGLLDEMDRQLGMLAAEKARS